MRVHLSVLGCRLNEAEIEALARAARTAGHEVVDDPRDADWAVINTCTVTHVAARKSRQAIRQLHRQAPEARLAVMGCYATMSAEDVGALAGVALVIPNTSKEQALALMESASLTAGDDASARDSKFATWRGRTRAFIKVQDGCDNHCTYCVVCIARGPSRSRPLPEVLEQVLERADEGAQEGVLSGVNIGAYGRDLPGDSQGSGRLNLSYLVREVLERTTVPRIRLSSLEPWDVDETLLALWDDPRLCRQLHLPLQSGSDAVLNRMGRPMGVARYRDLVARVRARVPEMSISTDLIVGFPGESEEDFSETCRLARAVRFSRLHVFRFSPRAGTVAADLPDRVADGVVQQRARELASVGQQLARDYHQRYAGQKLTVLFETAVAHDGVAGWSGLTDNYLRIWVPSR
ncbi:MAG: tRNA (N(6)-L-threonylcarbamoyladenosine(37)-C(2))-methylthiotransferase MtaB, partial [Veillonellaceae bacterium]|nr:tRNA (N(6)-L-threonylcarbamoyladenosine(37)-C(2))-methylthiotransferase MtaB [Veillonellaceae bacterium]